ncbi:sigma factor-like helix-turn-helix DNA-binding protein [Clostridium paraputrificum]|uniref:sigma factor-like helix-turn-helix DNA-binding protein n=1 Tax=Clostridium paraputrificum TaxID=29363 RepID=UPI0035693CB0
MTPKEYLKQAYRLDHRINSDIAELGRLREMSTSISSPSLGEKVQTNRNTDAPFVKCLERIYSLEEKINEEIDLLVNLKEEIRSVIDMVSNTDERMVLRYRYIHNYTWEQIGDVLGADSRTVRRWHGQALGHVILPENLLKI